MIVSSLRNFWELRVPWEFSIEHIVVELYMTSITYQKDRTFVAIPTRDLPQTKYIISCMNAAECEKCSEWPQMILKLCQMFPIYVLLVSTMPNFHSVSLSNQPFCRYRPFWDKCSLGVTCLLEKSAPDDPKVISNPTRAIDVPIYVFTSVPDSQISVRFALRPGVFGLQAFWRKVHQITPKWPCTLQGQMFPIYVLLVVSTTPKFHSISLYDPPFSR